MMQELKIGYVGLSKGSWLTPAIERTMELALEQLHKLPCHIVTSEKLTTTEDEALELCNKFVTEGVDAVVLHFVTFPVGAVIPIFAQHFDKPFILFSNPEEIVPGGPLERNSFCGANMAAHTLNRMGRKYCFTWGQVEDTADLLESQVSVLGTIKSLSHTRIGLAGGRVPGFYTSNFNELKLRKHFGVAVEVIELLEVVTKAQQLQVEDISCGDQAVQHCANKTCDLNEDDLLLAKKLYTAFRLLADKYSLDCFAVRCWPEFSDIFGIAPCAILGMLTDSGLITSCEGDIPGAVTMKILSELSDKVPPFFADLISFDYDANTGVAWHCGAAPAELSCDSSCNTLRLHMRVDGGDKKGLTNEFPLKPGPVTLAKLDEDADGNYRMLIAAGTALPTSQFVRGNPLSIKFDGPMRELIDTIMEKGFEHHYCIVHADVKSKLQAFCKWLDVEAIVIE